MTAQFDVDHVNNKVDQCTGIWRDTLLLVTRRTFNALSRKHVPCEWTYASRRHTARPRPVNSSIFSPFVTRPYN